MSIWIGYAVSVNCGEPLGCYQGTILEADGTTITLTKAFRNGFPYPKAQVTINAADIKDLKIIENAAEPGVQPHSTVAVAKSKKGHRTTVCESLQANHNTGESTAPAHGTNSGGGKTPAARAAGGAGAGGGGGGGAGGAGPARSKPIDIQPARANKNTHAGSSGNAGSTPKTRGGGAGGAGGGGGGVWSSGGALGVAQRRNEACFGAAATADLDDDFDFEGNLALFDKRALWEQMRGARPDLLRTAPDHIRHDESVLPAAPAPPPALQPPPGLRGPRDYVTDRGAPVASAAPALRRALWAGLRRLGLLDFSHALLARAAADVALRLVGGGRRLEPRNAHQAPRVVAVCGAHGAGAAALAAARVLASHGARAAALLPPGAAPALARERAAAGPAGVQLASDPRELAQPDLVLLALHDPRAERAAAEEAEWGAALRWAAASRAALVALEPPAAGWAGVAARAAVVALAPPALPAALGRVYLADVAPPARLFEELGVAYRPPFGAASLLALYPADE